MKVFMEQARELYGAMFTDYPDVVSVIDVAKMLGIGQNNIYNLIRVGAIKTIRVGRKIRVPKISVIEFILNQRDETE